MQDSALWERERVAVELRKVRIGLRLSSQSGLQRDEVALLRRLADAQQVPLSTVIRHAALAASTRQPIAGLRTEMNEGAAGSGWAFYDSFRSQFAAGSTVFSGSAVMNYQLPPANTV